MDGISRDDINAWRCLADGLYFSKHDFPLIDSGKRGRQHAAYRDRGIGSHE